MPYTIILTLILFASLLGINQIIFKKAVIMAWSSEAIGLLTVFRLFSNPYFWVASIIYLGLGALWFWILTKVPIAKAYPFVVLSFIFVAVLEKIIFNERIELNLLGGIVLILLGLTLITK